MDFAEESYMILDLSSDSSSNMCCEFVLYFSCARSLAFKVLRVLEGSPGVDAASADTEFMPGHTRHFSADSP